MHRSRASHAALHESSYSWHSLCLEVLGNQEFRVGITFSLCYAGLSWGWVPVLQQQALHFVSSGGWTCTRSFHSSICLQPGEQGKADEKGYCRAVRAACASLEVRVARENVCKASLLASWFLPGSAESTFMTSRSHFFLSLLSNKAECLSWFVLFLQVSFFHCLYSEKTRNLFLSAFSSVLLLALSCKGRKH